MLSQSCETLPYVGPALSKKLAHCGIVTVQDLLFYLPMRYQDRTRITPIQDLRVNDWCVIQGQVRNTEIKTGKRLMLDVYIEDNTGIVKLRFFKFNRQQVTQFNEKPRVRAFGEVREFSQAFEFIHPDYKIIKSEDDLAVEEHLTPIYPSTLGLSQGKLRQLIQFALQEYASLLATLEWMSDEDLQQHGFYSLPTAVTHLHNPPPGSAIQTLEQGAHPGLKRLVFDELLAQRLSMQFAKQQRAQTAAPILHANPALIQQFLAHLPFGLTAAQLRVYQDIQQDLIQAKPMLRLIQGDVGSGKTMVAALAALQAIANGYQVALMAPTDLLSEQHAQTLEHLFSILGYTVQRLSGKMNAKLRKSALAAIASHQAHLIIGTHALFQDAVTFAKLGLIIIDEQHRFGVEQRLLLHQKGQQATQLPHQLLMTATPIPRTLAMAQFAHMDLSIIDELPPGRTPVITAVLNQAQREPIIERLSTALASGRQAYWVCTLIEESEKLQCMAATETAAQLQAQLPSARIGLIHGRLKTAEKDQMMMAFKTGEFDLLVATTVIEVGVNVPNASLMIIENAERLGLSQLHQLRGRVGRGSAESHCILLYQAPLSQQSAERLRIMRATTDGFVIAEKDLALRGAGEVLGTKQTGYRAYKIADLARDACLLPLLQPHAEELLNQRPEIARSIAKRWLGEFESFLQG